MTDIKTFDLTTIREDLENGFNSIVDKYVSFTNGFISNNGAFTSNASYICTGYIPLSQVVAVKIKDANQSVNVHIYDENKSQVRRTAVTASGVYSLTRLSNSERYVRIWTSGATAQDTDSVFDLIIGNNEDGHMPITWANGILYTSGVYEYRTNNMISSYIPVSDYFEIVGATAGFTIVQYNKSKSIIEYFTYQSTTNAARIKPNNAAVYIRVVVGGTSADGITINTEAPRSMQNIVILGDSWSDTYSPTEYTKWPAVLESEGYSVHNYARNGSRITGDTPSWQQNGNLEGQVQQFLSDGVKDVDTIVMFGGINDFRGGVAWGDVAVKLEDFTNRLKAVYPYARIIYVNNCQLFITYEQLWYFHLIADFVRRVLAAESFVSFGWINPGMFIDDMIHPNDNGHKAIAANMKTILNGGNPFYIHVGFETPASSLDSTMNVTIYEKWVNGWPDYSCRAQVFNAGLGTTQTISIGTSDKKLLASVPFVMKLNKVSPPSLSAGACNFECTCSESFNTNNKMNSSNTFTITAPTANSGVYKSENRI